MNLFKHKIQVQIRFKDGDIMGHVNNANHFTYFELARVQYFREVVSNEINWNRNGVIIARMTVDYKRPLLISDEVFAYTRCSRLGTKSFDLEYLLVVKNAEGEQTVATGVSTIVCFNYETNASIPIPEEWRKKMSEFDAL